LKDYIDALDAVKLRLGLQIVMAISAQGNNYLQSSGLNKALMAENPVRCAQVISRAVNLIYALAAIIYPYMPATSASILQQLNAPARAIPEVFTNDILAGHTIGKPEHLFKKIEETMAEVWRVKFGGNEAASAVSPAAGTPDPLKAAPGQSKKKAAVGSKKAAAPVYTGPKSEEALDLEAKITEQGNLVRGLKAEPKTPEQEEKIKVAVDVLKKLKGDLDVELQRLAAAPAN
jgi:methionyl-tRNA synthetase